MRFPEKATAPALAVSMVLALGACGKEEPKADPYEHALPTTVAEQPVDGADAQGRVEAALEDAQIVPLTSNGRKFRSFDSPDEVGNYVDDVNEELGKRVELPTVVLEVMGSCSVLLSARDGGGEVAESTVEHIEGSLAAGNYGGAAEGCRDASMQVRRDGTLFYQLNMP